MRVEQFQFYKKSYFVCCLVRGFAEEEKIVIEARRQRRRLEEERQQMANNQVNAHQQLFASFELFQCFVAQNPAPAATPAATFATVPTATPAMRSSKEVEELRKRQEELMEAAIKEKEARVLSKNKERREYKEKEERLQKEKEEAHNLKPKTVSI